MIYSCRRAKDILGLVVESTRSIRVMGGGVVDMGLQVVVKLQWMVVVEIIWEKVL